MSMSDVEFELSADGELIIGKNLDREHVIQAMKRAIAKNNDEVTPAAYTPPAGEGDDENDEEELTLTPEQQRERARRLLNDPAALAGASVNERTQKKETTMPSLDEALQTIAKSGLCFDVLKRFVKADRGDLTEHMVTTLLLETWGATDFAKNLVADTSEAKIARAALQRAKHAAWGLGT